MDELIRVFGVVAVEVVVAELQHKPSSQERFHFGAAKFAVQSLRQQQRDVVERNARLAEFLYDYLDSRLAKVGALRPKVVPGSVVECDDYL